MAKPPQKFALRKEDFPGQETWIEPLIRPLNTVFASVADALTNRLTSSENFDSQTYDYEVEYTGASVFPAYFSWKTTRKPNHIWVTWAYNKTTEVPVSGVTVAWEPWTDNQIKILTVAGLTATNKYLIRLRVEV